LYCAVSCSKLDESAKKKKLGLINCEECLDNIIPIKYGIIVDISNNYKRMP